MSSIWGDCLEQLMLTYDTLYRIQGSTKVAFFAYEMLGQAVQNDVICEGSQSTCKQ